VHAARIRYQDDHVHKIVGLIDSLGLGENTLIIFTSDNGGMSEGGYKHPSIDPGPHDHKFFNSNGPLRGFKRDLYEGGIRVPFIARWTGTIEPNITSTHIRVFWDMMATFADIAGVGLDYEHDGISILPELTGKEQPQHDYLYWEFLQAWPGYSGFKQAVRMNEWKAVRYGLENPVELYNLDADIGETNDISDEFPEIVARMDSLFEASTTENPYYPYGGVKVDE
jgi:arylsulfatase A-like enzyme